MSTETTDLTKLRMNILGDHLYADGDQDFVGQCTAIFLEQIRQKYSISKMVDGDLYG